ncbi:MAG: cytochrome c biogenesis protein CcsA [Planctomycetes bacterium]|nr:cytochrome c biogenesis protein CcsA [Planctomycetota bacterium]
MSTLQALAAALPAAYLSAAGAFALGRDGPARWILRAALVLHTADLVLRWAYVGHFPVTDLATTLSVCALATAGLWALVARDAAHTGSGGLVLALVAALSLAAAAFANFAPVPRPGGMGPLQVTHVATSAVSLAALVLSGLHGALWLVLFRAIRARRFGPFLARLPNLDTLAKMTRRAALLGFVGLSIGLNVGIGLAHAGERPGFAYRHPEVLLSLALWLHFGVVAFSQAIPGLGARRASWAAAGGLALALLSGVLAFLPRSFHGGL